MTIAVHAERLPVLCEIALATWQELATDQVPDGKFIWDTRAGRIVLHARISRTASCPATFFGWYFS